MKSNTTSKEEIFPLISYEQASPEVREIYDDTKRTFQLPFVLNWFQCQGSNVDLLRGNWAKLKSTLVMGEVPNVLKQLIIYHVSSLRNCDYCSQAHGIFANTMRDQLSDDPSFVPTEHLESEKLPKSYRTAITVVSKAALYPQQVTAEDIEQLHAVGFRPNDIRELLSVADLVNMLNTIADVSGIKIDESLVAIKM
tara:strand:- start:11271 stop:11858 length:588 start_codon:yes stop_codon:yes gene_type:complete